MVRQDLRAAVCVCVCVRACVRACVARLPSVLGSGSSMLTTHRRVRVGSVAQVDEGGGANYEVPRELGVGVARAPRSRA